MAVMARQLPAEAMQQRLLPAGTEQRLREGDTQRLRQQGVMVQGAKHPQEAMELHLRQVAMVHLLLAGMVNERCMLTENNGWENEKITHCSGRYEGQ